MKKIVFLIILLALSASASVVNFYVIRTNGKFLNKVEDSQKIKRYIDQCTAAHANGDRIQVEKINLSKAKIITDEVDVKPYLDANRALGFDFFTIQDGIIYESYPTKYELSVKDGAVVLGLNVGLFYCGDEGDDEFTHIDCQKYQKTKEAESFAEFEKIHSCMNDFFQKHGITLSLNIAKNSSTVNGTPVDQTVYLWYKKQQAQQKHWVTHYMYGPMTVYGDKTKHIDSSCSLTAHELAHSFGLPERYEGQPESSDRVVGPDDEIMKVAFGDSPLNLRFTSDLVEAMLEPLCGKMD